MISEEMWYCRRHPFLLLVSEGIRHISGNHNNNFTRLPSRWFCRSADPRHGGPPGCRHLPGCGSQWPVPHVRKWVLHSTARAQQLLPGPIINWLSLTPLSSALNCRSRLLHPPVEFREQDVRAGVHCSPQEERGVHPRCGIPPNQVLHWQRRGRRSRQSLCMTCSLMGRQGARWWGAEPDSCHVVQTATCLIPLPQCGTLAGPGPWKANPSRWTMRPRKTEQKEQKAGNGEATETGSETLSQERRSQIPFPLFCLGFFFPCLIFFSKI